MSNGKQQVYFDHMANTPPDGRVVEAMLPHLKETFGNPLNLHDYGAKTAGVIEESRQKVAKLIFADPNEIIFTSSGSESNNFAIKGMANAYKNKGKHIITSSIEHFSVLYPLKELEKEGFNVTYLPVDKYGMIDPEVAARAITPATILITLTQASNEIGSIEPIKEIAAKVKKHGVLLHIDAVQTAGTVPVNVNELEVDALSFSANQFYGPTGVAALYLRKGTRILPFILGGTQEEGKRAGTHNIPGIVGMGKAAELADSEMGERNIKLVKLRDKLLIGLQGKIADCFITGHPTKRLPGHASLCAKYVEGESMSILLNMEGIAVSTGSACVSKALKASHVLLAVGINQEEIHGSLVFSMGKDSLDKEVEYILEKLPPIVNRLREMSPLGRKERK